MIVIILQFSRTFFNNLINFFFFAFFHVFTFSIYVIYFSGPVHFKNVFLIIVCHHESNLLPPKASIWNLVHQITLQSTPFHFSNYLTNMNLLLCNPNVHVIVFKLKPTFHSIVCHPCHPAHKCFEHVHGCPTSNHSDTTIREKKASY